MIRTQLKQCQDELNLVCNEKKKLSDEMRAYARRWKEADREVVMVVEYAQEHPNEVSGFNQICAHTPRSIDPRVTDFRAGQ